MKWILILLLVGCTAQRADNMEIIWTDGECLLIVDGMTLEQAKEISKNMQFKNCDVQVKTEIGAE